MYGKNKLQEQTTKMLKAPKSIHSYDVLIYKWYKMK